MYIIIYICIHKCTYIYVYACGRGSKKYSMKVKLQGSDMRYRWGSYRGVRYAISMGLI